MGCSANCRKISVFIMLYLICCAVSCAAADISISAAKLLSDSPTESISLSGKVVTYADTNFFYIEEDSRSMGIRVEKTAHGLTVGMRADITGTMKTNANKERAILASIAMQTPAPNSIGTVSPIGMNNLSLGGGDWNVAETKGQHGVAEAVGLNNIGLLVKTWGKYQQVNATTFTIDDGTGYLIKCTVPSSTYLYSGWQYVNVTGISSMYKLSQYPYPTVYPPTILVIDIEVVSPVEAVSVPGMPSGNAIPIINVSETYSTTGSTCSWDHPVEYSFNWGDGTSSPWSTSTSASHSWNALGTKTITVNARCQAHPAVSATSSRLQVNVVVQYTIQGLSTLGGNSIAYAINDSGQVVGYSYDANNHSHACLWQNGVVQDLGLGSCAYGINAGGQVVGTSAFLWQNGSLQDLGTPGGNNIAYAINDSGQVVGWSSDARGNPQACLWQNRAMQYLGTLGTIESIARGINDFGQVVGEYYDYLFKQHAFLWQNGVMQDLGILPGGNSIAYGINNSGQVVGAYGSRAFLWQNGVMQDLGTFGGGLSIARGINDSGQVVVWSQYASGDVHACLWQNGGIQDLGALGGESCAYAINSNGQVVGYSDDANNHSHACLWTSVP